MITQKITDRIKSTLNGFDEKNMHKQMLRHYKLLHLVDSSGNWAIPALAKVSSYLLPENITEHVAKDFVDEMAELAMQNPYLVPFFEQAVNGRYGTLAKKMETEGKEVIPNVIAFALVLERMTRVMYEDPRITEACVEIFQKLRKDTNMFKKMSFFFRVKLKSLEGSLTDIFLRCHKTGIVPPDAARWMLPINILEASITDFVKGNKDNAKASILLAFNKPGSKKVDPRTGAGPSTWSEDKKAVRLAMPLPLKWADLYQTWNMAFVSHLQLFPYLIPKLLIPMVAKYRDNPQEYIHKRVLALYLTIYHSGFSTLELIKNDAPVFDWSDKELTRLWGKVNLESSIKYKEELGGRKLV